MTAPICLLTRPHAQSVAFARDLPGIEVLIAPILRIEALPFDPARISAAPGIVFTSANAVPLAGPGKGKPALCVGPQTAEAAAAAGYEVEEGPGDAEGMMPLLPGREAWLHLHGRHRARELPVQGMAIYDQIAQPLSPEAVALLSGDRPVILPLFSPRSASLLAQAAASATAPIATVAISARADECYDGPTQARLIAERPEGVSMARAILSLRDLADLAERSEKPWVEAAEGRR